MLGKKQYGDLHRYSGHLLRISPIFSFIFGIATNIITAVIPPRTNNTIIIITAILLDFLATSFSLLVSPNTSNA